MHILKGRLDRNEMSKFIGVEARDLDRSLAHYANLGWLKYRKIKGGYRFTLYPEPVNEIKLNQRPVTRP